MKPVLFIDRDGTIIHETADEKIEKIEKLTFLEDAIYYLRLIKAQTDFLYVMVTNQDGLGTEVFPEFEFWPVHNFIIKTLEGEKIYFENIHIDDHFEHEDHPNRKPGIGMLKEYFNGQYDLENSFVIGDRATDVQLAKNLGCKSIYIQSAYSDATVEANMTATNWKEIYDFLV